MSEIERIPLSDIIPEDVYRPDQVAEITGLSGPVVHRALRNSKLAGKNLGGSCWRIRGADLTQWINSQPPVLAKAIDIRKAKITERARQKAYEANCRQGFVYFISDGEQVKIGFTTNIEKRRKALQTSSAFDLALLAAIPGPDCLEKELHQEFRRYRLRGEWFKFSAPIREYISQNCGDHL